MRSQLIALLAVTCALLLVGCAGIGPTSHSHSLLRDDAFLPRGAKPDLDRQRVFALSDEMRHYLRVDIAAELNTKGNQRGLIDALYSKHQLKLDYDAEFTRSAAETFNERAGNCLSLVIMTAAFAKELRLPIQYQRVHVEEVWSRQSGMFFASNHVNITLGRGGTDLRMGNRLDAGLTIDFYPVDDKKRALAWRLEEETILAMYFNNRAAESLARADAASAYWYAREAMQVDPNFVSAYNTLAVAYRRVGMLAEAEGALVQALRMEPRNLHAMSNLAIVLSELGREEEARVLHMRLAQLRPEPPYHYFNLGMQAMRERDYGRARELFAREVDRAPYNGEFHYWLGVALAQLGDANKAKAQLALAIDYSATRSEQAVYSAKLGVLRSKGALAVQ